MFAQTWIFVGFITSVVFLCVGFPIGLAWPYLFSSVVQLQLEMSPSSFMFSALGPDSPIGIYMDIYLWNLTNAEEFAKNRSVIPEFEDVGPFVYKVTSTIENATWNDNFTVTYSPKKTYILVPEESLNVSTPITNINPLPAVLAYFAREWDSQFFLEVMSREVELRETLLKTESAENWLFKGINDTLVDLIIPLKKVININFSGDKFAWFYGKNDSNSEGIFTMFTGANGLDEVGVLNLWNGKNQSDAYDGECGTIGGSSGQAFPRMKNRPDLVSVFAADACSQVSLQASGDSEVEGVPGWKFIGGDYTLDNGTKYPSNECFCSGECVPTGVRNVSSCKSDAPAFISFPHFYLADEVYRSSILGMAPNASLHETSLVVEPTLGIPLSVQVQLQVNLMLQPSEGIKLYKDVPQLFFPILWFRQRAILTPGLASLVNFVLALPVAGLAFFYSISVVAALSLIIFTYLTLRKSDTELKLDAYVYSEGKEMTDIAEKDSDISSKFAYKMDPHHFYEVDLQGSIK